MQMTPYSSMLAKAPQSGPCMIDITTDGILAGRAGQESGGTKKRPFHSLSTVCVGNCPTISVKKYRS